MKEAKCFRNNEEISKNLRNAITLCNRVGYTDYFSRVYFIEIWNQYFIISFYEVYISKGKFDNDF